MKLLKNMENIIVYYSILKKQYCDKVRILLYRDTNSQEKNV